MPMLEFFFRLEHMQACMQTYQVPWREVLCDFHVLVEGQANEFQNYVPHIHYKERLFEECHNTIIQSAC